MKKLTGLVPTKAAYDEALRDQANRWKGRATKAEADNERLATIASRTIEAESAAHGAESRAERAEARVKELEAKKWEVQHTDTMNEIVQLGIARDGAETQRDAALNANVGLEKQIRDVPPLLTGLEIKEWIEKALSDTPNPPKGKLE